MSTLKTALLVSVLAFAPPMALAQQDSAAQSDAAITARVETALIRNDEAKARQINVETENGIVQLSGFVDSERAKDAATTAARGVSGVKDVRNELIVGEGDRTLGRATDDTVIEAKVKSELAADSGLKTAGNVNVEVRNGVVQLSGFVPSSEQKTEAEQIARRVAGVKDVRNTIAVEPER